MKNLGMIGVTTISAKKLHRKIGNHEQITFDFIVDVQDFLDIAEGWNNPIEGLNERADEEFNDYCPEIGGSLSNISYCFHTRHKYKLPYGVTVIRCTASVEELEWPEDVIEEEQARRKEQARRDEKNGLYPQHEDAAN